MEFYQNTICEDGNGNPLIKSTSLEKTHGSNRVCSAAVIDCPVLRLRTKFSVEPITADMILF